MAVGMNSLFGMNVNFTKNLQGYADFEHVAGGEIDDAAPLERRCALRLLSANVFGRDQKGIAPMGNIGQCPFLLGG